MLPAMAVPSGFFVENGRYEFLLLVDGLPPPSDVAVLINDVPRDYLIRAGRAVFPYETEFTAGAIRVDVVRAERVAASVEIIVDPAVAKLTRDEYATMIAEISEATLALYRLGGATVAAAVGPSGQRSDVVTLDLVRTNIDAFEQAVGRIADRPLRVLRSAASETALEHAKWLDDRALEGALRSRHTRAASDAETRAAPALVAALRGVWIPRIVERTGYESIDIYEHRAILGFVRWLDAALGDMARRLSDRSARCPDPATAVQSTRLALWRARLSGLARRSLFAQLRPDWHLRPTSAFRMRPDYVAAFKAMSRMRSGLGGKVSAAPAVPLERTHVLYEIWCYVLILRAVAERYPAARAGVASILRGCTSPSELSVRLLQGTALAVQLEPSMRLIYQRRFGPVPDAGGARTLVVEAIPDIVLERIAPVGQVTGVAVLDPKYRTGASLLDGIRDLHMYRDAVLGNNGSPLVRAAVALAPRTTFPPPVVGRLPRAAPCVAVVRPGHDPAMFDRLLDAAVEALDDCETEREAS